MRDENNPRPGAERTGSGENFYKQQVQSEALPIGEGGTKEKEEIVKTDEGWVQIDLMTADDDGTDWTGIETYTRTR